VNRETVAKVREMFGANVRYLEYEPETEKYGGDIYRKWGDAVQHVETEYSQIVTDKEFLIPTSIIESILFLENNLDYVSSGGKEYQLKTTKENILDKTGYFFKLGDSERTSERTQDGIMRFRHSISNVAPMHNSMLLQMMRTDDHKYQYNLLKKYSIIDIKYGEIILGYIGYLAGKYHCIENNIYVIRDTRRINLSDKKKDTINSLESSAMRYLKIYTDSEKMPDFYKNFRKCLVDQLISFCQIGKTDAEIFVDTGINVRISNYWNDSPTLQSKINTKFPFITAIWYRLPTIIQNFANTCTSRLFQFTIPMTQSIDITDNTKEEGMIIEIVETTSKFQHDDLPIPHISLSIQG